MELTKKHIEIGCVAAIVLILGIAFAIPSFMGQVYQITLFYLAVFTGGWVFSLYEKTPKEQEGEIIDVTPQ